MLIDLSYFFDHFLAYSFVVLDLFILAHFLLNLDDYVRMEKEVLAASLLDTLDQRVIHQFFDGLAPSAIALRKYLAHHI